MLFPLPRHQKLERRYYVTGEWGNVSPRHVTFLASHSRLQREERSYLQSREKKPSSKNNKNAPA